MPFITGGFPDIDTTPHAIEALAGAGASAIEVGIPFSDPIADGPVIAASMHAALSAGVTPSAVFKSIAAARKKTDVGIIAMVSASIVVRIGVEKFIAQGESHGVDGFIIPDMDLAEAPRMIDECEARRMAIAFLVAPTSTPDRVAEICASCRGFVYLLTRAGITGEVSGAPDIAKACAKVRACTALPVAAGFGISSPQHVAEVTRYADAAIVGSALVRRMSGDSAVDAAAQFTRELAAGLRSGARSA